MKKVVRSDRVNAAAEAVMRRWMTVKQASKHLDVSEAEIAIAVDQAVNHDIRTWR